jgi:hypothetical protein
MLLGWDENAPDVHDQPWIDTWDLGSVRVDPAQWFRPAVTRLTGSSPRRAHPADPSV